MTDHARDLLLEEQQEEPVPTPPAVRVTDRRRVTAEALAAAAARTPTSSPPGAGAPPGRDGDQRHPGGTGRTSGAVPERPAEPAPERPAEPAPAPGRDPARRAALLATTLGALAAAPERADVDALLVAHAGAPSAEVEQAARTVTAVFLRAPSALRRALRAVLAPAVERHRGTPLADRLAVRLAGGARPSASAAAAPSGGPDPADAGPRREADGRGAGARGAGARGTGARRRP